MIRIALDVEYDLQMAGQDFTADEIEDFENRYTKEIKAIAEEKGIEIEVVCCAQDSSEAADCDSSEAANELWQLAHDRC